jgi:gliding motility-associated-like protein
VTNAAGCSSLPATVNVAIPPVLATPGAPVANSTLPYCEGDAMTLTTSAFPGPNAVYTWHTPTGTYNTSAPSLTISNLTVSDAGAYTVQYMVNDCPSGLSASTPIAVNPAPLIQPASNSPVCEGQTIQLSVDCTTGAVYEWSGSGGFSSSVCNPVIANANPSLHAGTYTVRKKLNGCWSDIVAVNLDVKKKPTVPTALNAGPYCANTDNVMLSIAPNTATPGAMYSWFNSVGQALGAATASLNFSLPDPAQYGNGGEEFYTVATLEGCPSAASVPTVVMLNTIPSNQAEAGPDIQTCEGNIILLQSTQPTAGAGYWSLTEGNPTGVTIANPDQAATTVSGLKPGEPYLFQWSLSNGACENYSTDVMEVFVNKLETADAGESFTVCHTTTVNLDATESQSNIGTWTQPASQAQLGVVIVDPGDPKTEVRGLVTGNSYLFTWTIDGGCGTSSDAVLVSASDDDAFAGADMSLCGPTPDNATCVSLSATPPSSGYGRWSSPDRTLTFDRPDSVNVSLCNLKKGRNTIIWTINDGACGQFSVDSVIVTYTELSVVYDEYSVAFGGSITGNLTDNDVIPGNYTLSITQQPRHGKLTLGLDGQISYKADFNYLGKDIATYEVCLPDCDCVSANITFDVNENAGCEAPSIITPNGDNVNDAFVIPCLANTDRFPTSLVSIFNQWGDEVFKAEPYQNDWQGTFDGEDLPAGTYFYIVDLKDGSKPMSGYLIIQR